MNFLRKPFRYSFFNATLSLILINTVVFFLFWFFNFDKRFFGLNVAGFIYNHFLWQPVSYMFVHGNFQHLLFNMLGLLFFGMSVEKSIGSKEFLLMYFSVGILSGLFSVCVYFISGLNILRMGHIPMSYYTSLIGASGAIYGILFAFAVIFPKSIIYIWGLIPVPAPLLVFLYALVEFASQFFSSGNVAHLTHLAGFGFVWLYFMVRMGISPINVWKNAYRK